MKLSEKFSWKNGADPSVIVARLKAARTQKNKKVSYTGFQVRELNVTLMSFLTTPSGISAVEAKGLLQRALFHPTPNGQLTPSIILQKVKHFADAYYKKKSRKFHLLTSLSYRGPAPFNWLQTDRARIYFHPSKSIIEKLISRRPSDISDQMRQLGLPKQRRSYRWVVVEIYARSPYDAYEFAMEDLDETRGLMNLMFNRNTSFRWSSGNRQPINQIRLGQAHTIHDLNGASDSESFWYEPEFVEPSQLIDLGKNRDALRCEINKARRRMARSGLANDTKSALIRYANALDHPDWSVAFRELWSVLEFLTNSQRSSYDVTIKRMASMYEDHDFALATGKHLRDRRNRLVHADPSDPDSETLMMQAKGYIETLLSFYITNPFQFKSRDEVGKFLDLPRRVEDLDGMHKLVNAAKHFRA